LFKVSIALNPFLKDEYFIAFDDGTFCYKSEALGGHCEPPKRGQYTYVRHYKHEAIPPNPSAEPALLNLEIRRGQEFDKLMKGWKVKENLQEDSSPGAAAIEFEEWETVSLLSIVHFASLWC